MEKKVVIVTNTVYKILVWIALIMSIVLLVFTIRVHKDMEKRRKFDQMLLEKTVNGLIEKRLVKPLNVR